MGANRFPLRNLKRTIRLGNLCCETQNATTNRLLIVRNRPITPSVRGNLGTGLDYTIHGALKEYVETVCIPRLELNYVTTSVLVKVSANIEFRLLMDGFEVSATNSRRGTFVTRPYSDDVHPSYEAAQDNSPVLWAALMSFFDIHLVR